MPILPIHSKEQFYSLFQSKYEFILLIIYSPIEEENFRNCFEDDRQKSAERDLDTFIRYLDRLSDTDKYAHVLFVEVNADVATDFVISWRWPTLFLYKKNGNVISDCYINTSQGIRTALSCTLRIEID